MKSFDEIGEILDEIIVILSSVGETNWCEAIKTFRKRCDSSVNTQDQQDLLSDIMRIYGGMGSFSDLILYRDGQLLEKKSSQLDDLRKKLFEAIRKSRKESVHEM